jgi:hypothetical protein
MLNATKNASRFPSKVRKRKIRFRRIILPARLYFKTLISEDLKSVKEVIITFAGVLLISLKQLKRLLKLFVGIIFYPT